MEHRKVSAGRGPAWLNESIGLIGRQPAGLLGAAAIFSLLSAVPQLLGPLGLPLLLLWLILWPALMGGIVLGMREADASRPVTPSVVFAALRSSRLTGFLPLCLPLIGALLLGIGVMLGQLDLGKLQQVAALMEGGRQPDPSELAGLIDAGAIFRVVLAGLALMLVSFALTFLAIPLVTLRGVGGFAALGAGLRGLLANLGAFLLYLLVAFVALVIVGVAMMVTVLVLSLLLSVFGEAGATFAGLLIGVIVNVLVTAVIAASQYLAWKDIFGGEPAISGETPPPPPRETIAEL